METEVLGFAGNNLKLLKLNSDKEIVFAGETDLGFNINDLSYIKKNRDEILNIFPEKLNELINFENLQETTAGVVIDSSLTFLNVIPVDFDEDTSSINSSILWELSNYFPDNYKDFNVRYYKLGKNPVSKNIDEILIIAVDKTKINFIINLCNNSGLKIKNVEIDQFAVEKYIKEKYRNEFSNGIIFLSGFKSGRIDFSLLEKGKIKCFDYSRTDKSGYVNAFRKLLNSFKTNSGFHIPEKIFIYGDEILSDLKNILNDEFGESKITVLSPFKDNNVLSEPSSFAPLYGLALKNAS